MKVYIRGKVKELVLDKPVRVRELVEKVLKLNPEEVLVIDRKIGKLLTPDAKVEPEAEIEVRMVVSGG